MVSWHKKKLDNILAGPQETLLQVLPRMEKAGMQVILVADKAKHLIGIITDGDIRRALLRGNAMTLPLKKIMQPSPKYLSANCSLSEAREMMLKNNILHIPLVQEGKVVDILLWLDLFETGKSVRKEKVVIMAGGKGTRLDPFTKILPKPMIPIGDKPMVEVIMDKLNRQGFSDFTLSLGYKGEIVRMYFQENNGRSYNVNFIQEQKALGTAGSLAMLKEKIDNSFVVTNCDIILETQYAKIIDYHKEKGNQLTIIGALRDFTIPYGVLTTEDEELNSLEEKPSFHFLVNTGVYILEPDLLYLLKENQYLDMPKLIKIAKTKNMRVGVYPHHGKWFDVGQWEEYRQTLLHFDLLGC